MRIKYISCDGESVVEEPIIKAEMFQGFLPPHDCFLRCARPDGDVFEIYDLSKIEYIQE